MEGFYYSQAGDGSLAVYTRKHNRLDFYVTDAAEAKCLSDNEIIVDPNDSGWFLQPCNSIGTNGLSVKLSGENTILDTLSICNALMYYAKNQSLVFKVQVFSV